MKRVTEKQLHVLRLIVEAHGNGISYTQLRKRTGLSDPSLGKTLARWQKSRYINRDWDRMYKATGLTLKKLFLLNVSDFILSDKTQLLPPGLGAVASEYLEPFNKLDDNRDTRILVARLISIVGKTWQDHIVSGLRPRAKKFVNQYLDDLHRYAELKGKQMIKELTIIGPTTQKDEPPDPRELEEIRQRLDDVKRRKKYDKLTERELPKTLLLLPVYGFHGYFDKVSVLRGKMGLELDQDTEQILKGLFERVGDIVERKI